jgi:CPA1 family monovalent cation:H+ antiporter
MVAWTGMRGVVSLAAALALPLSTSTGAPLPFRAEIVVITFVTILVTLVVQGLSLAPMVRLLGLHSEEDGVEKARRHARAEALNAALRRLDEPDEFLPEWRPHVDSVKQLYAGKLRALRPTEAAERHERRALRLHLLDVEREVLIEMRNRGDISDEILVELERDLDIEASQLQRSQTREVAGKA